jgi:sortase A
LKVNDKRNTFFLAFAIIFLLTSIGLASYPFLSDSVERAFYQKVNADYKKSSAIDIEQKKADYLAQEEERKKELEDPFSEESLKEAKKNIHGSDFFLAHTIGILHIPSITQQLPVYDSTAEPFMRRGATLLEGSDYPEGEEGLHSIFTSHSGLPEAKLFTDLEKIKVGEIVIFEIGGEYKAYKIFDKNTVEQHDLNYTQYTSPIPNKDLISLITCTPIGINTHRLIVTGQRVPFSPHMMKVVKGITTKQYRPLAFTILGILAVLVLCGLLIRNHVLVLKTRKQRFDLYFYIHNNENELTDNPELYSEFQLYTKSGKLPILRLVTDNVESSTFQLYGTQTKLPIYRKEQPLISNVSANTGLIIFKDLPGLDYTVKQIQSDGEIKFIPNLLFKAKTRKIRLKKEDKKTRVYYFHGKMKNKAKGVIASGNIRDFVLIILGKDAPSSAKQDEAKVNLSHPVRGAT